MMMRTSGSRHWLRGHIAVVITGLVIGNVLLIVILALVMR